MKLEIAEGIAADLIERLAPHAERIAVVGSIRRRRPEVNDIDLVAIPRLEVRKSGLFEEAADEPHKSRLAVALCVAALKVHQRGPKIISVQLGFPEELVPSRSFGIRDEIPAARQDEWRAEGLRVDLYLATPETWATLLLIRTGSAAHNIFLCSRARELGGTLHADGSGLELPGVPNPDPVPTLRDSGSGRDDAPKLRGQTCGPRRRILADTEGQIFNALLSEDERRALFALPNFPKAWRPADGIPPELRECDPTGRPIWLRAAASRSFGTQHGGAR